ncbi:MAG TPA: FkbM family methyltransferase [Aquaticitalea sp.]|nr:FkbM family methyltransferase [Aquaticitalea sp.]HNU59163.1 FkbM family methyltransferase [Aquaticitalea sp.]
MALSHTINFILNHPLNKNQRVRAVWRFLRWQLQSRLGSGVTIARFGEKSKIIVKRGLDGATGNLYSGLHEFEDMAFLLHFLRSDDLFVDVGANVGSYTILASNECRTQTIAIEPIPQTYDILKQNIELNDVSTLVKVLTIGLGNEKGVLKFTTNLGAMNQVAKAYDIDTIDLPVERFDDHITLDTTTMVKIDVEGFEASVIEGMTKALENEHLKAMIIELNGYGKSFGFDENLIHQKLLDLHFEPCDYEPFSRTLIKLNRANTEKNTIYIRDLEFVSQRLKSARPFTIRGQKV